MFKFSSTFLLHFIQKRFLNTVSTSTLPLASVSTIQFLTNSCGLSSGSPISRGRKLQFDEENLQQYGAVIGFFKSHGFEDSQIAKLVSRKPSILHSTVSTNLKPKFEFLQEIGIVGPLLTKEMLGSDKKVTAAICRTSWLLTSNSNGTVRSNIDVLVSEGVPSTNIAQIIALNPRSVMRKVDRMIRAVKTVKELGVEPKDGMFVYAVSVAVSMSDSTWKKKINVMKSLGWSENEIFTAFKRFPRFLTCSEEKMRDIADFCLNTAKLDPGTLISYPQFFNYSVHKRLQPRYKVLEVLKMKNLLKTKNIGLLFVEGERRFVEKYIVKHFDKIPNLIDIYLGNVKAETKSVL
uniref:Transcription termination factor MTERF5 n=1 Tax=Cucumis melo TaxID=3656 RepID=A0A9I9D210_CUCME